jgi:hypothetical protein
MDGWEGRGLGDEITKGREADISIYVHFFYLSIPDSCNFSAFHFSNLKKRLQNYCFSANPANLIITKKQYNIIFTQCCRFLPVRGHRACTYAVRAAAVQAARLLACHAGCHHPAMVRPPPHCGTTEAPLRYDGGPIAVQRRPLPGFRLQAKDLSLTSEKPFACKQKAFRL